MKYLISLFTVLLTLGSLSAAIDPLDVVIMADPTSGSVIVRSTIPMAGASSLELLDQRGRTLYSAQVAKGDFFSKRFDAKLLPTGGFSLIIADSHSRTTLPFEYQRDLINYSPAAGARVFFPTAKLDDNRMLVINYPASSGHTIQVRFMDDGKTVFTDTVSPDTNIRKAYQLEKLSAGEYTLCVDSRKDEIYSMPITLR